MNQSMGLIVLVLTARAVRPIKISLANFFLLILIYLLIILTIIDIM